MLAVFTFGIIGAKKDKIFNFSKGGPTDMIFGVFSETYTRHLKSMTSRLLFYQDTAKFITIQMSKVA